MPSGQGPRAKNDRGGVSEAVSSEGGLGRSLALRGSGAYVDEDPDKALAGIDHSRGVARECSGGTYLARRCRCSERSGAAQAVGRRP
jgi:hypothetical protein